ncbi:MAG: caspase family protein [Deltaproteobacteria bacterium]|nr:caspase family protein [Deltaproteobacteria bacterium]
MHIMKNINQFTVPLMMFLITFGVSAVSADNVIKIRRFAFVVGTNDGGPKRLKLRFANSDAEAVANVLTDLGGVQKKDLLLITNTSKTSLKDGFAKITGMLNAARNQGNRTELLFYYSGHSNEQGLLLGNDVYTYREMKAQIEALPARVRIGILDSCASGTLVRTKGGTRTAPFLVDASSEVKGVALLTSSSADEVAQESDRVGGSYFTHYLVSGMRGAADSDRDGRVTLNESYTYAFDETLRRTTDSQAGAQHPNYDFRLVGAGDLVMTDLRNTDAMILFAPEVEGHIFVRDNKNNLIAEINKRSDRPIKLGVPPGRYHVTIDSTTLGLHKGAIRVSGNRPTRVNGDSLPRARKKDAVARGDGTTGDDDTTVRHFPLALGIAPGLTTNGHRPTRNNFAFNFVGKGHSVDGMEVGAFANIRTHDVNGIQVSSFFNYAGTLNGAQISMVNVSRHHTVGLQASLINTSHTTIGLQAALINMNGDTFNGGQLGLINYSAAMTGLQAGMVNLQKEDMRGSQLGLLNIAASLHGAQVGMANINAFVQKGAQIGLLNYSKSTTGTQTGMLNLAATEQLGAQIGLFNYSHSTKGAQIGLVNIASGDVSGAQIGLISYAGDGILAPTAWMSDTGLFNLGFKMGNRYTYGIFATGSDGKHMALWDNIIGGFGCHFELHPLWMEVDALYEWIPEKDDDEYAYDAISKIRWTIGMRFFDQLSVYAGPAVNYLVSEKRRSVALFDGLSFFKNQVGGMNHELSLGMFLGIQWEPKLGNHNNWRGNRNVRPKTDSSL